MLLQGNDHVTLILIYSDTTDLLHVMRTMGNTASRAGNLDEVVELTCVSTVPLH